MIFSMFQVCAVLVAAASAAPAPEAEADPQYIVS